MTVLDRVPLDAIAARAERIRFIPTLLSLCAAPLMLLGYLVAGVWQATKWVAASFMIGFDSALGRDLETGRRRGPG